MEVKGARELSPEEQTQLNKRLVMRAIERAQTGVDLVLHGALHDLEDWHPDGEIMPNADLCIISAMVEEIEDHGLTIKHDSDGRPFVTRES